MSGFEIAGIVLGGFPILYEAAKTAKSRYKDLKWWWRISHKSVRNTFMGKQRVERSAQGRASLFTIGVLLVELLFRKSLESLPLREQYLGRVGMADYTADLCTSIQRQRQVEAEFGDKIADAIRRCVLCAFEPQPDLSDSTFIRAVCTNVAEPLEEFLLAWNTRQ
jgi:hypothetical protein